MKNSTIRFALLLCVALPTTIVLAVVPPDRMNYQGVLRDAADDPLDGSYDMVFKFFNAETLGDEILLDRHLAINAHEVQVSGGMFSVALGGGEVLDGSGPGTYASLAEVFAAHGDVWLEIEVGGETLAPRLPVTASAFALNAGMLDGRPAGEFVDTSANEQVKTGKLVVGQLSGTADAYGLEAYGSYGGGYFEDTDATGRAYTGWDHYGVLGYGESAGGYFEDQTYAGTNAYLGSLGHGIRGYGFYSGGYFEDSDDSGVAHIAYNDQGIWASGNLRGGYFADGDESGYAYVASGHRGVEGFGTDAGGYFKDLDGTGYASVGSGDYGIDARGSLAGGFFVDTDNSATMAYVANGDYGIQAYGNAGGAFFRDSNDLSYARLGYGDYGVQGYGNSMGGYFEDRDNSGYARLGYGDYGVQGYGIQMGGLFDDTNGSAFAYLAFGDWGLYGYGNSGGMTGVDSNSGIVGYLATGTSSTQGNGSKNFAQNHPYRSDQIILYAAPEGNEVATYTRGTARLVDGEAHVELDDTFAWVTNPDIGLTAHLTPRTKGAVLNVAELSTSGLVVHGTIDDAVFDYMVWGLRIGFEEVAVVQEKGEHEMLIPSMEEHRTRLAEHPELRKHVALDRFEAMNVALGKSDDVDLSRANALRDAVGVFDPAVHRVGVGPEDLAASERVTPSTESPAVEEPSPDEESRETVPVPSHAVAVERNEAVVSAEDALLPVSEPVLAGELLVVDESGELKPGLGEADRGVVGVAAKDSVEIGGSPHAALIFSGIAMLKVDADLGAIRRGDLLVSSPTPGHAMRAFASIPGTVVAKALEPLESGRGTIRVVVTLR